MMPSFKYASIIKKQLATFEALRRLKFSSDDIYVAFYNNGEVFTELRPPGEPHFRMNFTGEPRVKIEDYAREWQEACTWWNSPDTDDSDRREIFEREFGGGHAVALVLALKDKGIRVPRQEVAS
ncbi:MAG: hypothetical protein A2Y38_19940 [Spirochaetes bacterium GWB1_59_5]|nr:MAG: hypothetical protein A2Y38_19940 [Spirochaetes bacterium GWB1_59_5]